jgi:hypothetical protein
MRPRRRQSSMEGGWTMQFPCVGKAALVGLLVPLIAVFMSAPVDAATEPVTGTATTSGGNGIRRADFVYSALGILGSGTIHNDFVLISSLPDSERKARASSPDQTVQR